MLREACLVLQDRSRLALESYRVPRCRAEAGRLPAPLTPSRPLHILAPQPFTRPKSPETHEIALNEAQA